MPDSNLTSDATTPITIGANEDGSDYLQNAYVAEIIVYNKVLDSNERLAVERNQQKCYGSVTPVIAGKGRNAYQLEICTEEYRAYINNQVITAPVTFGQYQHVVMTYDQTNLKLYVDGTEVASKALSGTINTNSNNLLLGNNFLGEIDEFRITNVARPADRISADYHSGSKGLLSFDRSGFTIEQPGIQIANEEFNLNITEARDDSGVLLTGSKNVTVTSDQSDGSVHNQTVTFTNGSATVPVSLTEVATHNLTVEVTGVTNPVIVEVVVVAVDLSGFDISTTTVQRTAGKAFNLVIENATDVSGSPLNGNLNVTVTSDLQGELISGAWNFVNGGVLVNITLSIAGEHTLTVEVTGVTDDETIIIQVSAGALSNIAFFTPERAITAGGTSEIITIKLQDAYGNEVPSDGITTINLDSDLGGTFRNELDDTNITSITIADGQSEGSFRYTSTVGGMHVLTGTDDATVDPLTSGAQILTVDAAAPDKIVFITEEQVVQVDQVSEVITVQLQDQYNNVALSNGVTNINLGTTLTGNFQDVGNTVTITDLDIADQGSEANFRFIPTAVGTHTLSADDAASALTGDTQELIAIGVYYFENGGDWSNPVSWQGGVVPPENSRVIIQSNVNAQLDVDVTVLIVEMEDGSNFEISSSTTLTVQNNGRVTLKSGSRINVSSEGLLLINDGGQIFAEPGGMIDSQGTITNNSGTEGIIIGSDASNTGSIIINNSGVQATVQRYVAGRQWHVISSPVAGLGIQNFIANSQITYSSANSNYAITHYDEKKPGMDFGGWSSYYTSSTGGDMVKGKGYIAGRTENGLFMFSGELTSSNVTIPVTRDANGWNAIGNPFPSAIGARTSASSVQNFIDHNAAQLDPDFAAIYIYDPSDGTYKVINNVVSEGFDQDYIQSGQGFLVKSSTGGGNISFTNSMRAHDNSTSFYKKSSNSLWPVINLQVMSDNRNASTLIAFNGSMTRGLDPTYDAGQYGADESFRLYTRLVEEDNGVNMAIQALPDYGFEDMIIPVGFDFAEGGEVTFSAANIRLPTGARAILEDRELDILTDLAHDNYTVVLGENFSGPGRFFVHTDIQITDVEDPLYGEDDTVLNIYSYGKEIFIEGEISENSYAALFDLTGKRIMTMRLQPSERNTFRVDDLTRGVYIIHVSGSGKDRAKRLFIE